MSTTIEEQAAYGALVAAERFRRYELRRLRLQRDALLRGLAGCEASIERLERQAASRELTADA